MNKFSFVDFFRLSKKQKNIKLKDLMFFALVQCIFILSDKNRFIAAMNAATMKTY